MMNKIFIGLIAFLVVVCGALGGFTISLNGRVGDLNTQTQAFKADTASKFTSVQGDISSVDSNLSAFKADTSDKFTTVQGDITGVQGSVSSLNSDLSAFKSDTASKFSSTQNSINGVKNDITNVGTQLTESTMNVRSVYDDVIGGVCQIVGNLGTGSGFVYSADGYIVTCWHVITGESYTDVILHDGTTRRATVVGSDQYGDIAVLKISGVSDLHPLPLADVSTLVPGQPVIVVGNPLGIFETVTYGVISRTRGILYSTVCGSWITNLIQYDAPTNHGNSGGPVFDGNGEVIGIAAYIAGDDGMAYAVAADKLQRVVNSIINTGSFTNCVLPGIWSIDNIDPQTAINRGLDSTFGVIFLLAQGVGTVQANDICTAVDGVAIKDTDEFFAYISLHKSVGDSMVLTLISSTGTERQVTVYLVEGYVG